ncbi:MAG: flagellar biosynthesis protein FliQ [Armatimonadetes bacterium]|nr:flagellar biosynthesis protein FliQ [Armatimonadota bacterium]
MSDAQIIDLGRQTLMVTLKVAMPVLIVALVVGILVSILQAVTQIQEMTLTFIPKIIAIVIVLAVAGAWMLGQLRSFAVDIITDIPETTRQVVGRSR